jgi:hypothetical protein
MWLSNYNLVTIPPPVEPPPDEEPTEPPATAITNINFVLTDGVVTSLKIDGVEKL